MKNSKVIKDLIENSDMVKRQKNIAIAFIDSAMQAENKKSEDRLLIETVANENRLSEVLYSSDDVKIYTIRGNDDWDKKYPVRLIFVNNKGVWTRCSTVCPCFDDAYLIYLEHKHLGYNSQFAEFALKMLGINIDD